MVAREDILGTLQTFLLDPFVDLIIRPNVEALVDTPGAAIQTFSALSAEIGKRLPGGFRVERDTLSAELAARENLTIKGAHALMVRNLLNRRGVLGQLARNIIRGDLRDANELDLLDVRRVTPPGKFRKEISRRLREIQRRKVQRR